jgi:DNA adenine methylase
MSWVGGKKALREIIVSCFPMFYERYIEVFGGGGWVLFHKNPGNDDEVYNDFNSLLANLFRCVRDDEQRLIAKLRFTLNSREDFDMIRKTLTPDSPADPVERAAKFYQLIRNSYASGLKSFASQPHDIWADFPLIEQAHRRLAKVVIENQDFETLIRHYDRPVSLFYCDPPYYETEGYYANVGEAGFTKEHHIRLRDTLLGIVGKFLLSYNDCPFIREIYDAPGIQIKTVSRPNSIKLRYDAGAMFDELLIANYDMDERKNLQPAQLNLFGNEEF